MKRTILAGIFYWGAYQPERRIDFNGFFWGRPDGNVLFDPMPLDAARAELVKAQGGARWILLTNADHLRASAELKARFGAEVWAPEGDRQRFAQDAGVVDHWFGETSDLPPQLAADLRVHSIRGGKSPVEIAFYLEPLEALIFGDVVRSHVSGSLTLLPDEKLFDRAAVIDSLRPLTDLSLRALLLGDGDCIFNAAGSTLGAFVDGL